ncbi:MAG TPA: cytochrome c oxidase subunit II [Polyangia bacterium]|nr:cytochrome c oxidase subunit II [Polyangia bacterium]
MNDPASVNDWLRTMLFLPPQASTMAESIDHLHMLVILTTMAGSAAVGLMAVFFVIKYRHKGPQKAERDRAPTTPPRVEWALALGLFGLFFGLWVIGFMQFVRLRVAPPDSYDIYVTAKQWMWKFAYQEGAHSITTLYVPAGRPVKLIMTSRDVIHSFYVPDFRIKEDVIPGRYTTLWFEVKEPGVHDILCAEYCGTNHSTMRGQVVALDAADFARFLGRGLDRTATAAPFRQEPEVATSLGPSAPMSLVRLGQQVAAQQGCLRCHTLDGTPHIGPTWAGLWGATVPLKGGGRVLVDEAYLTESMMDPMARIRDGYQPVMPTYLGRLRPAETAALIELIKSLAEVRGQEPMQATLPHADETMPAGAIGQPPPQPAQPLLQHAPAPPGEPAAASQGLPPPGAVVMPAPAGHVTVGPNGPVAPNGPVGGAPPPGQPPPLVEEAP